MRSYLDLLQVEPAPPGLSALSRLTRAHVQRVPFENITSVLRRAAHGDGPVAALDSEAILEAWCARRGGGVCFEVAAMVDRLLRELGYTTHPVLAQITFPGSHQANLVELDGQRYLVDVGNGAPFPEPVALDGSVEVRQAGLSYRFRPHDAPDTWVQDRWVDGAWAQFSVYTLTPPDPAVREAAYQRHHTPGQSWVVDNLVLTCSGEDEVWSLRDTDLRHFTPAGKTLEHITEPAEYAHLAADVFGLPGLPIDRARAALADRRQRQPA
jgi:arylamine N-acetyltransferase